LNPLLNHLIAEKQLRERERKGERGKEREERRERKGERGKERGERREKKGDIAGN
jgi:hypothetical protein